MELTANLFKFSKEALIFTAIPITLMFLGGLLALLAHYFVAFALTGIAIAIAHTGGSQK